MEAQNEIQKLLELAENREEIGDHEGAKKSYQAALKLARESQNEQLNLICGYNFGTALVNTGEPRKGVEILLKMLSLLPGGDEPKVINEQHLFYNLGIGMAYIGDWKSCFEVMQKIINPKLYAKAAITRGKAAERMREFDQALVELSIARKAAEASRDYATLAQAWFIEGKVNLATDEPKKAQHALQNASLMTDKIEDDQEKTEHKTQLAEAMIEAKLYEDAQITLKGAKNNPKGHYLAATNFASTGEFENAIDSYESASKGYLLDGNLEMAGLCYLGEGKCLKRMKKLDEALGAFNNALATFEDITISSHGKTNGLLGSNACIGETLVKLNSTFDALTPLKEAAAITNAEQQRLQRQQEKIQRLIRKANRSLGNSKNDESFSETASYASLPVVIPPSVTNTLQSAGGGVLLQRPFLQRPAKNGLSYKAQLLLSRPKMTQKFFIQEGIDAAISGRVSSKSAQNVLSASQPLNRGRRAHGSGREERPGTASRFALRTAADDDSSEDENNKSARMILNEYDEGLNAVD
ncbi:unnamed protein product [Oikopleura dioica]|uniref:Uncharacterized protein n=1 Tax=Oikopleura dioica TaxID=34765 RepID=E4Y503_OIKDI|nr:unnamed protein product [Oikopleura dioica]